MLIDPPTPLTASATEQQRGMKSHAAGSGSGRASAALACAVGLAVAALLCTAAVPARAQPVGTGSDMYSYQQYVTPGSVPFYNYFTQTIPDLSPGSSSGCTSCQSASIPLPFDFLFFGTTMRSFQVCAHGYVILNPNVDAAFGVSECLPGPSNPDSNFPGSQTLPAPYNNGHIFFLGAKQRPNAQQTDFAGNSATTRVYYTYIARSTVTVRRSLVIQFYNMPYHTLTTDKADPSQTRCNSAQLSLFPDGSFEVTFGTSFTHPTWRGIEANVGGSFPVVVGMQSPNDNYHMQGSVVHSIKVWNDNFRNGTSATGSPGQFRTDVGFGWRPRILGNELLSNRWLSSHPSIMQSTSSLNPNWREHIRPQSDYSWIGSGAANTQTVTFDLGSNHILTALTFYTAGPLAPALSWGGYIATMEVSGRADASAAGRGGTTGIGLNGTSSRRLVPLYPTCPQPLCTFTWTGVDDPNDIEPRLPAYDHAVLISPGYVTPSTNTAPVVRFLTVTAGASFTDHQAMRMDISAIPVVPGIMPSLPTADEWKRDRYSLTLNTPFEWYPSYPATFSGAITLVNGVTNSYFSLETAFPFNFYGTEYPNIAVYEDGYIMMKRFGNDVLGPPIAANYASRPLPINDTAAFENKNMIAAFWTDLDVSLGGSILWKHNARTAVNPTTGGTYQIGWDHYIIWDRVRYAGSTDPADCVSFTIQLICIGPTDTNPGIYDIVFHYLSIRPFGNRRVTAGIQDITATMSQMVPYLNFVVPPARQNVTAYFDGRLQPLGMQAGLITDAQITSSAQLGALYNEYSTPCIKVPQCQGLKNNFANWRQDVRLRSQGMGWLPPFGPNCCNDQCGSCGTIPSTCTANCWTASPCTCSAQAPIVNVTSGVSTQFIQIDLGRPHYLTGIATQGRRSLNTNDSGPAFDHWTKAYYVTTKMCPGCIDVRVPFQRVATTGNGIPLTDFKFLANTDRVTVVTNRFGGGPVVARFVRIDIAEVNGAAAMKLEVYGYPLYCTQPSPCQNNGTCSEGPPWSCSCPPGFSGLTCEFQYDFCASLPCMNGGTCNQYSPLNPGYTPAQGRWECTCAVGWTGLQCQTNINECASQPCLNGGTCVDGVNSFLCLCGTSGYFGTTCGDQLDECLSLPCANGGTCIDALAAYTCTCRPGFSGPQCTTNINECASAPCQNGGTCFDGTAGYTCNCVDGFAGARCQTDIDECASQPCRSGGTCTNLPSRYTCACAGGFSGVRCEVNINECASSPCQFGGTCTDLTNAFTCACLPGYSGRSCQTNINECASQPCVNGACIDGTASFSCACTAGYSGVRCQTDINECASSPCRNAAACVDNVNSFTCACVAGYSGLLCATNINECASNPCANGGGCTDGVNSFSCACTAAFGGPTCNLTLGYCISRPCMNGGSCFDQAPSSFTCVCAAGYSGTLCQTDINECASNPCVNGATCRDQPNGYVCDCLPGWGGGRCQTDINECASTPCANGASCHDSLNGYNCTCAVGFVGKYCATDLNECASAPCTANGGCVDLPNGFSCACLPGWTGRLCETEINECVSDPCKHNSTCTDLLAGYNCTCLAGWEGATCNTNIDECASSPCRYGGTCIDGVDGFTCACDPLHVGLICQDPSDGCASGPCVHDQGQCENTVAGAWACICKSRDGFPNYSGLTCAEDVNECTIANGGCNGECHNTNGSWVCRPSFLPNTISSSGAYLQSAPNFVMADYLTDTILFSVRLSLLHFEYPNTPDTTDIPILLTFGTATVNSTDSPNGRPAFLKFKSPAPAAMDGNATVYFQMPYFLGGPYYLYLWYRLCPTCDWLIADRSTDTISYPTIKFAPNSLVLNDTTHLTSLSSPSDGGVGSSVVLSSDEFSVRLQIRGQNFPLDWIEEYRLRALADATDLGFGFTLSAQGRFIRPDMDYDDSSSDVLTFEIPKQPKAFNILTRFQFPGISIGGAAGGGDFVITTAPDVLFFPVKPSVFSVTGCKNSSQNLAWTWGCPTVTPHPVTLTIVGDKFLPGCSVKIKSTPCTNVVRYDITSDQLASRLTCTLPPGVGVKSQVRVLQGPESTDDVCVNYGAPVVNSVTGCASNTSAIDITNCNTAGGDILTLAGYGFGPTKGALVLIGSSICPVLENSEPSDSQLMCTTPPGYAALQPILVLQPDGGDFGSNTGTLSYTQCDAGQRLAVNGSIGTCIDCEPGTANSQPGKDSCTACENNRYSLARASECVPCTSGYRTGNNSATGGATSCVQCDPGSYGTNVGTCEPCLAGKYTAVPGQSACVECPAGQYQSGTGATTCAPCPPGTYSKEKPTTECTPAPSGYYAPGGEDSPRQCRAGTASTPLGGSQSSAVGGSSTCYSCVGDVPGTSFQTNPGSLLCDYCSIGFYWLTQDLIENSTALTKRDGGGTCVRCPAGVKCLSRSGVSAIDGYYVYFSGKTIQSLACLPQYCESCAANQPVTLNANTSTKTFAALTCCGANRMSADGNPLCGSCEPGYFDWGGSCIYCQYANAGFLLLLLIVLWVYVTLFHHFTQETNADTRIFLNYVQFVFLFMTSEAGGLTAWMALFNVNVFDASGQNCVAPLDALQKLSSGIFIPLLGFGFMLFNCLVHYSLWRAARAGYGSTSSWMNKLARHETFATVFRTYRRTFVGYAASSYPSFTQTVFGFFSCVQIEDDSYNQLYPSISCSRDNQYQAVYGFFVILAVVVVAFPPAVLLRLYLLNRNGRLLHDEDTHVVYGALTDMYKPSMYTWECLVLLRRMIVAAITLAPQFSNDPVKRFAYLCLFNVVYLSTHFFWHPFNEMIDNRMEAFGDLTLIVMTLFLSSEKGPVSAAVAFGLTVMCFTTGLAMILRILADRIEKCRRFVGSVADFVSVNVPQCAECCDNMRGRLGVQRKSRGAGSRMATFAGSVVSASSVGVGRSVTGTSLGNDVGFALKPVRPDIGSAVADEVRAEQSRSKGVDASPAGSAVTSPESAGRTIAAPDTPDIGHGRIVDSSAQAAPPTFVRTLSGGRRMSVPASPAPTAAAVAVSGTTPGATPKKKITSIEEIPRADLIALAQKLQKRLQASEAKCAELEKKLKSHSPFDPLPTASIPAGEVKGTAELNERIRTLQTTVDELRNAAAASASTIQRLEGDNQKLARAKTDEHAVVELSFKLSSKEHELTAKESECKARTDELAQKNAMLEKLAREHVTLKKQLKAIKATSAVPQSPAPPSPVAAPPTPKAAAPDTAQLQLLQSRLDALTAENARHQTSIRSLTDELTALKASAASQHATATAAAAASVSAASAAGNQISSLKSELIAVRSECDRASSERDSLREQLTQRSALIDGTKTETSAIIDRLNSQIEHLQSAARTATETHNHQIQSLTASHTAALTAANESSATAAAAAAAAATAANAELKRRNETITELQQKIASAGAAGASASSEVAAAQAASEKYRAAAEESANKLAEAERKRAKAENEFAATKDELDKKLAKAVKSLQSQREKIKLASERAEAGERESAEWKVKSETFELELTAVRDQLRTAESDRAALESKMAPLSASAGAVSELEATLARERAERDRERTERDTERDAERDERERLSGDVEREKLKTIRTSNELQATHWKELQTWHERVKASEDKLMDAGRSRDMLQHTIDALRTDIDGKQTQIAALYKRADEAKAAYESDTATIEKAHSEKYERLLREMKGLKERTSKQISELNAELTTTKEKITKLEDEIATGKPSERRIFQLAEMQARRDQTVHDLQNAVASHRKQIAQQKAAMDVLEQEKVAQTEQMKVLARSKTRSGVNLDYLKAVLVRFFQFENKVSERTALIPVIAQIMQFTADDRALIAQATAADRGLWAKVTGAVLGAVGVAVPGVKLPAAGGGGGGGGGAGNGNHSNGQPIPAGATTDGDVLVIGSGGGDMPIASIASASAAPASPSGISSIVYSRTDSKHSTPNSAAATAVQPKRPATAATAAAPNGAAAAKPGTTASGARPVAGTSGGSTPLKSALKSGSPQPKPAAKPASKPVASPLPAAITHAADF